MGKGAGWKGKEKLKRFIKNGEIHLRKEKRKREDKKEEKEKEERVHSLLQGQSLMSISQTIVEPKDGVECD